MKYVLLIASVLMLAGCNFYVGGSDMQVAEYYCRNNGGVQHINTYSEDTVKCVSGKTAYMKKASAEYSSYLESKAVTTP